MKSKMLLGAFFVAGILAYNCGGGGGSAGSGTVALYATDASLENAGKVEVSIKEIRMEHTGTGTTCTVFAPDTPYTIDLTDLKNTLQLLDLTNCPAGPYNRLVVVLEQSPVEVLYNGQTYSCSLTTYDPDKDNLNKPIKPNRSQCNDADNECYVYVTGAVNILANQTNNVALDFELKDSEINTDDSGNCSVAFKVSPLHAEGMKEHMGKKEHEIKGFVGNFEPNNNSFILTTKGGMTFNVNYSNETYDNLIQLAVDYSLKVEVECSSLDLNTYTCVANSIEVEIKGTALNVDTTNKTLSADIDGNSQTTEDQIPVILAPDMEWEGNIQNGSKVEVKIIGYDGSNYIAKEVEEED